MSNATSAYGYAFAMAADGSDLVLTGRVANPNDNENSYDLALAIGSGGLKSINLGRVEFGYSVAVTPDGKLVVGGYVDSNGGDFLLSTYQKDGTLDKSWTTDFGGGYDALGAVVVQPDGKVVAAGSAGNTRFALARYTPDGALDPSFATTGTLTTAFNPGFGGAQTLVRRPDGRLVASGYLTDAPRQGRGSHSILALNNPIRAARTGAAFFE